MSDSVVKPQRRRRLRVLLLLALPLLLLGAYLWFAVDSGPLTLANYDRIQNGMMLSEVTKILGEPARKSPVYPSGDPPYEAAEWVSPDAKTRLWVGLDETGMVLWKGYRSDTIVNRALRMVGIQPRPEAEPTVKGSPK